MKTYNFLIDEEIKPGDVAYRHYTLNKANRQLGEIGFVNSLTKNKDFVGTDKKYWCKLKTVEIKNAKIGDFILFKQDINYANASKEENPKAGDIFEITSIDGQHIRYKNNTFGISPEYVMIIESIELPDFNEDLIFNENTKVLCDTYEKAKNLCIFMHLKGKSWCTKESYLEKTNWNVYKNNTYYCTNDGAFGDASDTCDYIIPYEDALLKQNKIKTETVSDSEIKTQKKEIKMPKLQEIINQIFGTNDYQQKPNYLVVVYTPDGSEYAQGTAETLEQVENTLASDYRLIGHTAVTYKIHKEFTTKIPVVSTKLKVIKDAGDEVTE